MGKLRCLAVSFTLALLLVIGVRADTAFELELNGFEVTPPNTSSAAGVGTVVLNSAETQITVTVYFVGLSAAQTSAAIHGPALPGNNAPAIFDLPKGSFTQSFAVTAQQVNELKAGLWYIEVRSSALPAGEIRSQITGASGTAIPFPSSSGAVDATFGTGGIVTTSVGSSTDVAQAVAVQADGKILVAGFASIGGINDYAVVRYNPDGTRDASFDGVQNGNGIVTVQVGASHDEVFGIALQADGKIVLAGESFNGTDYDMSFARLNSDGTLDTTFDGDGKVIVPVGTGSDIARSVAIQSDGKIVATGNGVRNGSTDIAVVRLNPNGSLDAAFDGDSGFGNGIVFTSVGASSDFAYGLGVQADGKIVVAGFYINTTSNDTAILRLTSDGRLDSSFDGDGISTHSFSAETDEALSMTLQPDGRIVIAGCIRNGGPNDFLIARYNQNGSLDTSFSADGSVIVPFSSVADIGLGVAVQTDGKIVAAGFGSNGTNNDFSVTRVDAAGSLDTSFDGDGRVQTMIGPGVDSANAVAVQADGKIVVVGRTIIGATADFGIARYGYGVNIQANDGFINLGTTTAVRFDNAYQAGTSSVTLLNSASLPPLPAGWSFVGSPRALQTTALFSGDILVRITVPASIQLDNFNAVRILQFENGAWSDKTAAAPTRDFASKTVYARISSFGPLAAASPSGTASPPSTINGRLTARDGPGVSPALIMATATGQRLFAVSNPFGHFRFRDLPAGEHFLITVSSKRRRFAPRLVSLDEDIVEIEFPAQ